MKRLVYIISTFLILMGNVGADQKNTSTVDQSTLELAFWQTILDSDDPEMFQEYLVQFPEGVFAGLAKLIIKKLGGDTSATASDATTTSSTSTASSPDSLVWCTTKNWYRQQWESDCKRQGGKSYSDKSQAEAEHKRLNGDSSGASSNANYVWCATKADWFKATTSECRNKSGKGFSNDYAGKQKSQAEHRRLAGKSTSYSSTASNSSSTSYDDDRQRVKCKTSSGIFTLARVVCKSRGVEISGSSSSSSTSSSSNSRKVWCATKADWFKDTISKCRNKGGKNFSYNYAGQQKAQAEHKRLKGGTSSSTSTASTMVWCATTVSVYHVSRSTCNTWKGKIFSYKSQADAEYKRLKASSSSSASVATTPSQIYCATKYGVMKTSRSICNSQSGSPYSTHTRATKEHNRLSGKSYSSNTNTNYSSNTTKKKKKGLLSGFKNLFSGSPFVTVQMSPSELRGISDKQLCKAYRAEGFYSGKTPAIVYEVSRRGLDCYGVKSKCRAYGFKEGTSGFAGCVMQSEMKLVEEQRKQNEATIQNAINNLNPPAPAPMKVCRWVKVYDVSGRQQSIEQCN